MEGVRAVATTGIYCRPDCTARPNAANVRSFPTAAAAEAAGYRACLRCRPYRLEPDLGAIGPELVCRAVRLVVDGALDAGTEADLARQLGVSARHLRRVFVEHVGTTPDRLARSRRAHFARRLLDDTDLPIAQVAFAAGFGSLRQFNRALLDTFGFAPSELRARRRKGDRLVTETGLALRVPLSHHVEGETRRLTVDVDGEAGVIECTPRGDHLVLVAHLPHWHGLIHVVERARWLMEEGEPLAFSSRPSRP